MSLPLTLACLWVVAAAITAMLPMEYQIYPGIPLLLAAPVLIIWIGLTHGWLWLTLCLLAFASMFRRPLIYFARKAMGLPVTDPRDLRR